MVREGRVRVLVCKTAVRGPHSEGERRDLGFCEEVVKRATKNREKKRIDKRNKLARQRYKVGSRLYI